MLGLVSLGHGDMLRNTFTASTTTVEAGESITFRIRSEFEPGYPAELDNDEVCNRAFVSRERRIVIFKGYLGIG